MDLNTLRTSLTESAVPQTFNGDAYDVDPETGFFPRRPLRELEGDFALWERTLVQARSVLKLAADRGEEAIAKAAQAEQWRHRVRNWPLLDVKTLGSNIWTLRRAHYVLTCILHFYVHSLPTIQTQGQTIIPRPLAVPLCEVSKRISLPPVLTFADTVLWNWEFKNPDKPLSLDNMRYINVFSGNETEENFYLLSAAAELKGVEMLQIIERVVNMACHLDRNAVASIIRDFEQLVRVIDDLAATLKEAPKTVHPHTFYWVVRPWWNGSGDASPWVFEGVPPNSTPHLSGASAGQSSVMYALDAFLDVDHALKHARQPAPSEDNKRTASSNFMAKMRLYMPAEHREYLAEVQKRQVRDVCQRTPALRAPYNAAVDALKKFRDTHIITGTLFIVSQARSQPPEWMGAPDVAVTREGRSKGTGGNPVSALLKAGRDATKRTMLHDQ
ncbi:Indoleamine 2,3-dioxygenase [Dichomitus squalens]|uniref:Indoleamine 2,3-dioxygenase n=1 Tax=Dichomitus squalens TaxID=114155 RepID=A0A4Q9QCN7_9APHY|nr:Indoleamine 2,3-dioxygenase [Dichomitus squalens]